MDRADIYEREATPSGRSTCDYCFDSLEGLAEGAPRQQGTVRGADQGSQGDAEAGRLIELVRSSRPPPCPRQVSRVARRILNRLVG